MSRRKLLFMLALPLLAACSDDPTSTSPVPGAGPRLSISDGAHAGNPYFYFLQALATTSSSGRYHPRQFNAQLKPTVDICPLVNGVVLDSVAPFGRCDGEVAYWGKSAVQVTTIDEHYRVNWKSDSVALDVTSTLYRIRVFVGATLLGYADIDPVTTREGTEQVNREVIPLVVGRTLPIKFRIENGALVAPGTTDFVERNVPGTGGTDQAFVVRNGVRIDLAGTMVKTNTGYAAAFFPNGWLPPGYPDGVLVTVARIAVPTNDCHNAPGLIQFEGCYEYTTDPVLPFRMGSNVPPSTAFATPVYVAQCAEITNPTDPRLVTGVLFKSGPHEPLVALQPVVPSFVPVCDGFVGTPTGGGLASGIQPAHSPLLGAIATVWGAVTGRVSRLLMPNAVYAFDLGVGGEVRSFSRLGFGVRSSVAVLSGNGQVGEAGKALRHLVSVRVVAPHDHPDEPTQYVPLAGVPVTFAARNGGSVGATQPLLTDSNGVASTSWTLGRTGADTLTATIPSPTTRTYGGTAQVTFTASSCRDRHHPRHSAGSYETDSTPTYTQSGSTSPPHCSPHRGPGRHE